MAVTGDTKTDHGGIPQSSVIVPGNPTPVLMRGSTNVSTDNNDNTTTPASINLEQIGELAFTLGQKIKDGSISVTFASDQGSIPVLDTNSAPCIQGWIAATGTGTASQDDTLTFAQQVRKVVLYNASANNVPLEFDQTAAATSIPIPPGAYWIIDNVLCTTVHIYPSVLLPINTTSGLYVKGWK